MQRLCVFGVSNSTALSKYNFCRMFFFGRRIISYVCVVEELSRFRIVKEIDPLLRVVILH